MAGLTTLKCLYSTSSGFYFNFANILLKGECSVIGYDTNLLAQYFILCVSETSEPKKCVYESKEKYIQTEAEVCSSYLLSLLRYHKYLVL